MSRLSLGRALLVLAACVLAVPAAAQSINFGARPAERANELHFAVGLENAFVGTVGYSHGVSLLDHAIVLTADVALPWASFDLADFRLRMGALVPLAGKGSWKLTGKVLPVLRSTQNEINRMTNLGLDAGLVAGYYAQRWFIAAEAGLDWSAATYIQHSELYRQTGYAGAKDAWYSTTAANGYAGLLGGFSFERWDVVLRAGQTRDYRGKTPVIPLYVSAGINVRLPTAP
jgi:hypothetical protein